MIQTATFGDPQQRAIRISNHRFCQPKKDSRYGCQGYLAWRREYFFKLFQLDLALT
jgi:hypothetical protein